MQPHPLPDYDQENYSHVINEAGFIERRAKKMSTPQDKIAEAAEAYCNACDAVEERKQQRTSAWSAFGAAESALHLALEEKKVLKDALLKACESLPEPGRHGGLGRYGSDN